MKKIILILITLTPFLQVHAQDNLQFSQVKLVSTFETVPTGKVWKVESALVTNALPSTTPFNVLNSVQSAKINVNGQGVFVATRATNGQYHSYGDNTRLPIWLPAGATLSAGNNVSEISVIEFNVSP